MRSACRSSKRAGNRNDGSGRNTVKAASALNSSAPRRSPAETAAPIHDGSAAKLGPVSAMPGNSAVRADTARGQHDANSQFIALPRIPWWGGCYQSPDRSREGAPSTQVRERRDWRRRADVFAAVGGPDAARDDLGGTCRRRDLVVWLRRHVQIPALCRLQGSWLTVDPVKAKPGAAVACRRT